MLIYIVFTLIYIICCSGFVGYVLANTDRQEFYSKSYMTIYDEICLAIHDATLFPVIFLICLTAIIWPIMLCFSLIFYIIYNIIMVSKRIFTKKDEY
jgi:hypothetical protein